MELDDGDEDKENEEEEEAAGGDALPMPILGRRNPAGGAPNFIPEPSPAANFETLEAKFAEADSNGDSKVSHEEFVEWYNHTIEWANRRASRKAHV